MSDNFNRELYHILSIGLQLDQSTSFDILFIILAKKSKHDSFSSLNLFLKSPSFSHFKDQHSLASYWIVLTTKFLNFAPTLVTSRLLNVAGALILEVQ